MGVGFGLRRRAVRLRAKILATESTEVTEKEKIEIPDLRFEISEYRFFQFLISVPSAFSVANFA